MKISCLKVFSLTTLLILAFGNPANSIELPPKTKGHCYFPNSECEDKGLVVATPKAAGFDGSGWGTESIGYNIFIEKHFPKRVYSGIPYQYKIAVMNLSSDVDLDNVNIIEIFPKSFEVLSTDPVIHDSSGDKVAWALGKLKAKETKIITVNGIAKSGQEVPCCTEANFKHPDLCLKTDVLDPGLEVVVKAPDEVLRCDVIPLDYTVKNTGSGEFSNIEIFPSLPSQAGSGEKDKISTLEVGNLGLEQSKTIRTMVNALPSGNYSFAGTAKGTPSSLYDGDTIPVDVSAKSNSVATKVLNPELKVVATTKRSERQYIGRTIGYDFKITNTGDGIASSALLEASIPPTAVFQSASDKGRRSGSSVNWNLGNLLPNESKTVSMTLVAKSAGEAFTNSKVNGVCVNVASASTSLPVVGVPALLLETVDSIDPLEIGDSTVYEIRVTNQGNGIATNITLSGQFEDLTYDATSAGHTPIENVGKAFKMG